MLSRGVRPVLVVGLAAVLLGACSGGGASTTQLSSIGSPPTSPLPAASPSLAALPSSSGTRAPSSAVRACRAGDVAAGAVWWTGATAEMAGGFALWDTASEPCSIGGRVTVQLLDGSGKALPLAVQPFETAAPVSVVLLPGLGSPTPGAEAWTSGRPDILVELVRTHSSRTRNARRQHPRHWAADRAGGRSPPAAVRCSRQPVRVLGRTDPRHPVELTRGCSRTVSILLLSP